MVDLNLVRLKERWHWHVKGQVQGVGFRPFVFRVATHAGVTGRVFNDASGVHLEIQGTAEALAAFEAGYAREMPPLAKVEACERREMPLVRGERGFVIQASPEAGGGGPLDVAVTVDTAVCADCLREMRDVGDRRHGHGLINCTNCGPRFSIVREVPYDRRNTTMAEFAMCPACRREYEDPGNRRFHAQPIGCKACGPKVQLVRATQSRRTEGRAVRSWRARQISRNPFRKAAELLLAGKIVAIKGLGGFHLAVRADDEAAVQRLRSLKQRDAKPFAMMCRDVAMVRQWVELSAAGEAELSGERAPIVLAPRLGRDKETRRQGDKETRGGGRRIADAVATGTDLLGVMLPYTPVHHLLWKALEETGEAALPPLVLTSGNLSQEPLVIDNADALERLGPLCDAILWHDRPIERCVDDSVYLDRGAGKQVLPIRRSRGYAPTIWAAPAEEAARLMASGICVGGELKSTVAIVRGGQIILSQHLGDLSDVRAYGHFRKAIDDLVRLFHVKVEFIGHDLHPNYMSTVAARELAAAHGARLIGVQHHVAHAFGAMGEHHLTRALALVCDGTGYGTDGSIWGGELLEIEGAAWKRVGRLRPMRLPGGDAAARDPRRAALALLHSAYGKGFEELPEAVALFPAGDRRMLARMISAGVSSPWTSSTGRLFDAVAALLGICLSNDHEAQAPMALEAAARAGVGVGGRTFEMPEETLFEVRRAEPDAEGAGMRELDISAYVRWLVEGRRVGLGGDMGATFLGQVFHRALAEGWVALAAAAGGERRLGLVATGGSFCNRLLEQELERAAGSAAFRTFFHNSYPPTDAGLAFGQARYCQAQMLTPTGPDDKRE